MALSKVQNEISEIGDECLQNKLVIAYTRESASLAWQMVIQQPPMCLCVEDTKFNDDHHKLPVYKDMYTILPKRVTKTNFLPRSLQSLISMQISSKTSF
jgi:hypothetical protein